MIEEEEEEEEFCRLFSLVTLLKRVFKLSQTSSRKYAHLCYFLLSYALNTERYRC